MSTRPSGRQAGKILYRSRTRAGDHVPSLKLVAAAATSLGKTIYATEARTRLETLGHAPPPEVHAPIFDPPLQPALRSADQWPDARDGLSRAQRRVLWSLHALRGRAHGPGKAIDLIVEELANSQPPMSPTEATATLFELTHPWAKLNPLVEVIGHHWRLTPLGEELFAESETLEFEPGATCPRLLSARLPLLLAKGTDGIPPHNLGSLIAACEYLLNWPTVGMRSVVAVVGGPDFPAGGKLVTHPWELDFRGEGTVSIGPKSTIQTTKDPVRARIVLEELPWPMAREDACRAIRALALEGVDDVHEEGELVVVELEHVVYAWGTAHALLASGVVRMTHAAAFRIDAGGIPMTCDLIELLKRFLAHRVEVVGKRIEKEEVRRVARAEALEGVLVAAEFSQPVLDVLRDADNPVDEAWALMHLCTAELTTRSTFARHPPLDPLLLRKAAVEVAERAGPEVAPSHDYASGFSAVQAREIMRTRRLSSLPREQVLREWTQLRAPAAPAHQAEATILEELGALRARFARARRTAQPA